MARALSAWKAALGATDAALVRTDAPDTAWNADAVLQLLRLVEPAARMRQRERAGKPPGWIDTIGRTATGLPRLARRIAGMLGWLGR